MESLHMSHCPGPSPSEHLPWQKLPAPISPHQPGSKFAHVNLQTQQVSTTHYTPSREHNPAQLVPNCSPPWTKLNNMNSEYNLPLSVMAGRNTEQNSVSGGGGRTQTLWAGSGQQTNTESKDKARSQPPSVWGGRGMADHWANLMCFSTY
jgi:hypothetical protein